MSDQFPPLIPHQDSLSTREPWFQALVENASDLITIVAADGTILYGSPSLASVLGYRPEEVVGTSAFAWIHPDDRERCRELFAAEVKQRSMPDVPAHAYRARTRDGDWRWLESTTVNRLEDPLIRGVVVNTRDVTDRIAMEARIRESEANYRRIVETASEGVWMVDAEGRTTFTNEQLTRILGYAPEELLGRTAVELLPDEEIAPWIARMGRRQQGETDQYDIRLRCKDGQLRWFFVSAAPVRGEDGSYQGALALLADVTDRKRAEARNQVFQALGQQLNAAITPEDAARVVLAHADALLGWDACWIELLDPDGGEAEYIMMVDVVDGERRTVPPPQRGLRMTPFTQRSFEEGPLLILRRPGEEPHLKLRFGDTTRASASILCAPIRHGDQAVGAISIQSYRYDAYDAEDAATFQAMADYCAGALRRTQNQQTLSQVQTRFTAFMDHSPALSIMRDEAGHYVYVNRQFERTHGKTFAEVRGRRPEDIFPPETAAQFRSNEQEMLRQQAPREFTEFVTLPDGRKREFQSIKFPVRDEAGRAYVGIISTDVTDRRQLEEQLRQSQKMEAVGRLAGGVAHDFNNMLAVINGYSHLLLGDETLPVHVRNALAEMHRAGERAAALTGQLLAFSRRQIVRPRVLDLTEVVDNVARMLQRLVGEDLLLVISADADPGPILADPGQVEQVLINLVVNARDAMPYGGEIRMEVSGVTLDGVRTRQGEWLPPGRYVCLSVEDTGCGMDAETLAHAFEPFYTTKPQGQGTGLGLATVYGIVEQNQGHIEVESEPGAGTLFRVYFPVFAGESEASAGAPDRDGAGD